MTGLEALRRGLHSWSSHLDYEAGGAMTVNPATGRGFHRIRHKSDITMLGLAHDDDGIQLA